MDKAALFSNILQKKSFLCIGLDSDIHKIPPHLLETEDPLFEFNKQIIDATADLAVACKINTAFYEALGSKGWESMEKIVNYIPKDLLLIADAKRGDIGNTVDMYARAFFENLNFDAITVAPYMGSDSLKPFLKYPGKWTILLALTSNESASDFQFQELKEGGEMLFEKVIKASQGWAKEDQMMYVVGATRADMFSRIRLLAPNHFLLVPGVGAQGGDMEEVVKYGMNKTCGLLINASRAIIYADSSIDFAKTARQKASEYQQEMSRYLDMYL